MDYMMVGGIQHHLKDGKMDLSLIKEICVFLTALSGLLILIYKQVTGHRNIVKQLNSQDKELASIKLQVSNHLYHKVVDIEAKLDNLPCKAECKSVKIYK